MSAPGPAIAGRHGIDRAKTRVGPRARATITAIRAFAERAAGLMSATARLRATAQQQVAHLVEQQAWMSLAAIPTGDLRTVADKGIRLDTLTAGGYRSVADVASAHIHQLQSVPGVGPQTAQQVSWAAQRLADRVRRDTHIRLDPDRQSPGETQLLATLGAIRQADAVCAYLQAPLQQFVAQTSPLVEQAQPTVSRARMLFRGRVKKRYALAALAELEAILADPRVVSLQRTMEQQAPALDPNWYAPAHVWQQYVNDAAAFNALLSTVGGTAHAEEADGAAQGFIPEELRQEITAVPLDTSLLKATLRGYQVFGAQYAIHQMHSILGDEMGLGKTVQALAAIAHMAAKGQRRFLVVCPASVQINWLNEIAKHTTLTAHSLHGTGRDRTASRWIRYGGVAVTTFSTLGRLDGVTQADVAMLVVDEAHYVKNPEAQRSEHVARAVTSAQRALFLTGTPMENRVEEFRNLVHYLQPRLARGIDATDALSGAKRFRRAVAPVYLRRNQEDVLTELPDKIEVEDWVQLTQSDEAAYAASVRSRNLMQMRQAAYYSRDSAKLARLVEIVDEAREDGFKVVVFSNFLNVLGAVEARLGSATVGALTGSVSPTARQQLVDHFSRHDGHAVLLSQIEAGGVGLNVQAASVVILAEPQWKPSTEEQAIARAYRMGQVRKVQVHRLLAKGSVDERMREIQERKTLLFDEFARKSDTKEADSRAVDAGVYRPSVLDDERVPMRQRIVVAEQHRLGIA